MVELVPNLVLVGYLTRSVHVDELKLTVGPHLFFMSQTLSVENACILTPHHGCMWFVPSILERNRRHILMFYDFYVVLTV